MRKIRLVFYWVALVLLTFLYYGIVDSLAQTRGMDLNGEASLGLRLIAIVVVPLVITLALFRLWLLKPVKQKNLYFEIAHFAIPVLIAVACFAAQLWVGIILSVLAGGLIAYEFIRSVTKTDSMLLKKGRP